MLIGGIVAIVQLKICVEESFGARYAEQLPAIKVGCPYSMVRACEGTES
jgi:hypothetical protein